MEKWGPTTDGKPSTNSHREPSHPRQDTVDTRTQGTTPVVLRYHSEEDPVLDLAYFWGRVIQGTTSGAGVTVVESGRVHVHVVDSTSLLHER